MKQLLDIAKKVAEVSKESKLEISVDQYVGKFSPTIVELVYMWCKGSTFAEICKKFESLYEGSIIRAMRRYLYIFYCFYLILLHCKFPSNFSKVSKFPLYFLKNLMGACKIVSFIFNTFKK
jgi:hypothetical protein